MVLTLRVVISSSVARRVQLPQVPESVDHLIDSLREKLQLQGDFSLQFEDPDFGNALCLLSDISELPQERAILHIHRSASHDELDTHSLGSISSLSTASQSSSSSSTAACSSSYLRSRSEWPSPFPIPSLSYDVELKLRKGNETYEKTRKGIDVTRDIKMEILDKIAQAVFDIKAYPDGDEIESIASALVLKYPCLKEPGGGKGFEGWLLSIKDKLNNYRAKLRKAGCTEVSVNKKRKADENQRYTLKRAKRGEVNHIPEHPSNHDETSLEEQRILLVAETKKSRKDMGVIKEKMAVTFSLRRREVVEDQPMVVQIQERWPALFLEEQICEEFFRVTNKDLLETFRAAMDKYTTKLLRLYRARKGAFGHEMEDLLRNLDEKTSDIVAHRKSAVLEGLPLFLREDPTKLFKKCLDTDPEDVQTKGVSVGVLVVLEDSVSAAGSSANVQNIAIVLEEAIVLDGICDTPTGLAYLFGLFYALNLSYPKELKYTLDAIQNVFMELGSGCTQRVRSLKNKLLL
ncbi:uncharacterized protein LOC107197338 [Astyanax mexicanus]|uniref:Uncharacterized LOC107197338 n=1 Tax=Astyanax mexicanus TaxID=7994 RepID=A0A3B1K415_ASTMX|nr:uncharacterized protein LOC107197338 [Astyanax mexicanus]